MSNPNRTAYMAQKPRKLVATNEQMFSTRTEANSEAEKRKAQGETNVRVTALTTGPRTKPVRRYIVRTYVSIGEVK
jgi:hypothetical protein